ncbi:unnamed protein product [Rangifer tarandus platyrhynchus]|uniref:Uncharacterized protein n=1 Tax=Rangifer tarandus platyrhynchus TaxID=3082113 RepID=A0ABN8ZJ68_RANTA|nr:unnamed protein product [Rangifer tarandus platyrhynchus]
MVPLGGTQPRPRGDPHAGRRTTSASSGLPPGWPHCPVIQGCLQGSGATGQQPGRGGRGVHEASSRTRGARGARERQSPRLRGPCGAAEARARTAEPVPLPGVALTASHDLTHFIPKHRADITATVRSQCRELRLNGSLSWTRAPGRCLAGDLGTSPQP